MEPPRFSADPKDEEFFTTRLFDEPLVPTAAKAQAGESAALAKDLLACGSPGSNSPSLDEGQRLAPLRQFLANHPQSRWTLAVDLNLGLIYRKTGYWTRALDAWEQAWAAGKTATEPRARALADRAVAELAELNARLGRYERLQPLFAELDAAHRTLHGAAQDKLAGARQGLWMMDHQPDRSFRCGPMALTSLQRAQDPHAALDPRVFDAASTRKGIALSQVAALSRDIGRPMQMAYRIADGRNQTAEFVTPAIVHWKAGHYAALVDQKQERYRIDDPTFGNTTWVSRAALEAETDGYFLVPSDKGLPPNWRTVDEAEGNQVWGKGVTNGRDPNATGCGAVTCQPCPQCGAGFGGSGAGGYAGPDAGGGGLGGGGSDGGGYNGEGGPSIGLGAGVEGLASATGTQAASSSTIGMAAYNMEAMLTSLAVIDTPLSYQPPRGPDVSFTVRYSQHEASQPTVFPYWNLGQKWTSNWLSYVQCDYGAKIQAVHSSAGSGAAGTADRWVQHRSGNARGAARTPVAWQPPEDVSDYRLVDNASGDQPTTYSVEPINVAVYLPGGGVSFYGNPTNSSVLNAGSTLLAEYSPQEKSSGRIVEILAGTVVDANGDNFAACGGFRRYLSDGTVETYAQPDAHGTKFFLTQSADPSGNTTTFSYDGSLRLLAVTDALGQVTTLTYGLAGDPLKVTQVTDPFGRACSLSYNDQGQLQSITDPVGIQSRFDYQAGSDFLNRLTTPYGTTTFAFGDASTDPALGTTAWLEATDPYGDKERVEFNQNGAVTGLPYAEPTPAGLPTFNAYLYGRNSFFWDKKAYQAAHRADGTFDYTQAQVFHFLHGVDTTVCSGVLESTKSPLTSRVWRFYQGQNSAGFLNAGMSARPACIARLLDDGSTQLYQYQYNAQGRLTQATDPLGRVTCYDYDPANGVDLRAVRCTTAGLNEVLASATYDAAHRPLSLTDAAGQTTTLTYNACGQPLSVTDAAQRTVTSHYDAQGYLLEVDGFDPSQRTTLAYDGFGRLASTTGYPDGYTVQVGYDAVGGNPLATLNRPVNLTFPDGSYTEVDYTHLEAEWLRDREGHWTHRLFNPLRQNVATIDALGQVTQFGYCKCGQLVKIIDPNGHVTQWKLDAAARPVAKVYADNTEVAYAYEASTGRLRQVTDAKGQTTTCTYNLDNTLAGVTYAGGSVPTPGVSYTYDPLRGRLLTMQDGVGTTTYSYYPLGTAASGSTVAMAGTAGAGRVASVSGPLPNQNVSYRYDPLGRVSTRTVDGLDETYGFDGLGRLQSDTNALGTFTYGYEGTTGRLTSVLYPNGVQALYTYQPGNAQDHRLSQIQHRLPSGATLDQFDYGYAGPLGQISHWGQQQPGTAGAQESHAYDLAYDAVGQLTRAVYDGDPASLNSNVWRYDPAGNRVGIQAGSGTLSTATPTETNALLAVTGGGKVRVAGTLDKWAQVQVNGQAARPAAGGTSFEAQVALPVGTQTLSLQATDASGNVATSRYQLTISAGAGMDLGYDANGNTTSLTPADSAQPAQSLGWDAADRLVSITQAGHVTRWDYDGAGRRVRESLDGAVLRQWTWDGLDLAEERDASNQVTRRFYAQGEQVGGQAYSYSTDHLGSVRALTDASGTVRASYRYDAWGVHSLNQVTSNAVEASLGYTGHYFHAASGLHLAPYRAYSAPLGRWLSHDPIGEDGGVNLYAYVENDPIRRFDTFGLYITYGGGAGPHYWDNYRQQYNMLRSTPTGQQIIDYMESSRDEFHIVPIPSGVQSVTTGKNISLRDGAFYNTLAHECQHAITNVTGNPDTIAPVSDPADAQQYGKGSSQVAEREAVRMQNIVTRELLSVRGNPGAASIYKGVRQYTYADGDVIEVPNPFGRTK